MNQTRTAGFEINQYRSHENRTTEKAWMNVSRYVTPLHMRIGATTNTAHTRPGWSVRITRLHATNAPFGSHRQEAVGGEGGEGSAVSERSHWSHWSHCVVVLYTFGRTLFLLDFGRRLRRCRGFLLRRRA